MSPAFSSTRQAGGFALLLVVVLLLPVAVPSSLLPSREQIYASLPWNVGPYPFIHDQIFVDKSDIDIAIIGDSQIWAAVDAPYLQRELSEKLGRPAVVVSLCCPWAGFDGLYFLMRDLLKHRKVHMIVFADATGLSVVQETPHKQAWRWFRFAEDSGELAGLPLRLRGVYYYGSILGMPRNLVSLLRPNLGPILTPEKYQELEEAHHWIMPNTRLGSLAMQISFDNRPDLFSKSTPETGTQPSDFVTYSPGTAAKFQFAQNSIPSSSIQIYFARKLAALARAHDAKLTCLNIPFYADRRSDLIHERYNWDEAMQAPVNIVGIPPSTLFDGLSDHDLSNLFWDSFHFNENGQLYFTRLLAPTLINLYEN